MRIIAAISILFAEAVQADPLDLVDYELLFETHAEEVQTIDEKRHRLVLGQTIVTRHAIEGTYFTATDMSGSISVGCLTSILASLDGGLAACDVSLDAHTKGQRDDLVSQALQFYADNAFPATSIATVERRYAALVRRRADETRPQCADVTQSIDLIEIFLGAEDRAQLDGIFLRPRLPVNTPCLWDNE